MNCRSFVFSAVPALLGVGLLAGCPDRTISQVVPSQGGALTKQIPISADIDILFVIDNSASTADKQTVFASNFPNFVTALDQFPTGRPNLHIGVVDTTIDIGAQGYGNGGGAGCPSPDPADNGLLQNTARVAGCSPPNGAFISDVASGQGSARTTNYSGTLQDTLSCIAQVGANGCGFEAQLEAMKRALDPNGPQKMANQGFIRDGAFLAIIFLTDEDDASTKDATVFGLPDNSVGGHNDYRVQPLFAYKCDTPLDPANPGTYANCVPRTDSYLQDPAFYSTFLAGVKDPAQVVVAVIAGPPPGLMTNDVPPQVAVAPTTATTVSVGPLTIGANTQPLALQPSCNATINGNPAIGRPALRLASFLSAYGNRGRFYSICQSDYSAALADIGKTLFNAVSPCLEGNVTVGTVDPNNLGAAGLDCTVSDVLNINTAMQTETAIPTCAMTNATTPDPNGARPCWWIKTSTTDCPAPDSGYELQVERANGAPPPTGTTESVECAVGGAGSD